MKETVLKAYRTNILKVYSLVYSLVAVPMAYYGLAYIKLFLAGKAASVTDLSAVKKSAYAYPLRLVTVMVSGWTVLLNLIVFIPMTILYSGTARMNSPNCSRP